MIDETDAAIEKTPGQTASCMSVKEQRDVPRWELHHLQRIAATLAADHLYGLDGKEEDVTPQPRNPTTP